MLLAIPFGLAIGVAVGLVGGGGSVLAVPTLVYVLDQPVAQATTTSLFVVSAGAVAGAVGHARAGRVCWRHAISFSVAAVPGIALGTLVGEHVAADLLLIVFAVVMVLAAQATWSRAESEPDEAGDSTWEGGGACPPLRLPRDAVAGVAVGFITGLVGVGGGFLIVPTLAIALAFTLRTAIGTSLVIISATALVGAGAHLLAGRDVDVGITTAMAAACAVAAIGAAGLAGRVPQRVLGRAFAALVVAVAGYLVVSVALLGGAPAG